MADEKHLRSMHFLEPDEPIPECCTADDDGCQYERGLLPFGESFYGINRSTAPSRLTGALFDASGKTMLESIEEATKELLALKPPGRCGAQLEAHLTPPCEVGEATRCVKCGTRLVPVGHGRCVEITEGSDQWYRTTFPPPTLDLEPPRWPYGLNIIASDACPADRMFLLPTLPLSPEEAAEARELMKRGHSEESAVAEVRAKKSAVVKVGDGG